MIVWIHKEVGEMDRMDKAKYGIHLFAVNLRNRGFTYRELAELAGYFARELRGVKPDYDQTS